MTLIIVKMMIWKVIIVAIILITCKEKVTLGSETGSQAEVRVLISCLGGPEERAMTSSIASLLSSAGYHVALLTYGGGAGAGLEVIRLPMDPADTLYTSAGEPKKYIQPSSRVPGLFDIVSIIDEETANQSTPLDQEEEVNPLTYHGAPVPYDVLVTSSIRHACKQTFETTWKDNQQLSRVQIFATPLHYHDICTLTLADLLDLPVMGLVTSPIGSWWTWYHIDLLPPLATTAVPPNLMTANFGFLERAWNVISLYGYIAKMNSDWVDPLMTSLPGQTFKPLSALYSRVGGVIAAYDSLLFPDLPVTPLVTSMAGARWGEDQPLAKDILAPILKNRHGCLVVSLIMEELWVGANGQTAILDALARTHFTVVWRGVGNGRVGVEKGVKAGGGGGNEGETSAIFVQRDVLPIRGLLGHPRHRLLLSLCGLQEATVAITYASPVLCVPVTAEQELTAARLSELGVAEVVPAGEATAATILEAVRKLITDRSYRARGRLLAEEYLEAPLPAADRVLHTVQKMSRRPYRYKRRQAHGLSLLAQSNGDVMAAILILVTSFCSVAIWVSVTIWRNFVSRREEKKKEE